MNILDYKKNPIYRILETVKMEAKRYNIEVPSCELVGLMPKGTIINSLKYYYAVEGKEWIKGLSLEELTKEAIKYMGFRDFDVLKIIEANI